MNVDRILEAMNARGVDYLLIGGMNFLIRHRPDLTFDVDLWIDDTPENRVRCASALADLEASWGYTDDDWKPVSSKTGDWLADRGVFCFTSPHGAIDIFRSVLGLPDWRSCRARAAVTATGSGIPFFGLSDEDMIASHTGFENGTRHPHRVAVIEEAIRRRNERRT